MKSQKLEASFDRRLFLQGLAGAGLAAVPRILPSRVFGAETASANNRLNVAAIGTGGRCGALLQEVLQRGDNVVALRVDHTKMTDLALGGILRPVALVEVRAGQPGVLRAILCPEGDWRALGQPLALLSDHPDEPLPDSAEGLAALTVDFEVS